MKPQLHIEQNGHCDICGSRTVTLATNFREFEVCQHCIKDMRRQFSEYNTYGETNVKQRNDI